MRHSADRILTTHAGSLPRPDALRDAWSNPTMSEAEIDRLLKASVADIVTVQMAIGIDIPNDGEFGKPTRAASDLAAWGTYIFGRLSGFGSTPAGAAAPDRNAPGAPMRIVGQRWEQRDFGDFYSQAAAVPSVASRPTCIGPIRYSGETALKRDLAALKAATAAAGIEEAFVTTIAVGSLEMFCRGQNVHYARAEDFLAAIAQALAVEYRAIVEAGFVL
ncbi:MAG TPA: hypothetical protein VKV32_11680, partial [Stellaceae bacterium]|nr:hypothetical protein [Stellaceae bacterium]